MSSSNYTFNGSVAVVLQYVARRLSCCRLRKLDLVFISCDGLLICTTIWSTHISNVNEWCGDSVLAPPPSQPHIVKRLRVIKHAFSFKYVVTIIFDVVGVCLSLSRRSFQRVIWDLKWISILSHQISKHSKILNNYYSVKNYFHTSFAMPQSGMTAYNRYEILI